jgi:Zn-dependent membrane protease YugP
MSITWIIIIAMLGAGFAAQAWVRRAHKKGSDVRVSSGLTGAQAARVVLDGEGLASVPVERVPGQLTDHYDPRSRTVRLSEATFDHPTPAAVAIATHEVGHAIQHAQANAFFRLRSAVAPAAMVAQWGWFALLMVGVLLGAVGFVWMAIAVYLVVIAFHVVTLPVEFDASRRAGQLMQRYQLVTAGEAQQTKSVLTAAASTYVVAAISSVALLLAYVLPMLGGRE